VRIYPKDALLTTYTYEPLIGMTSSTDAKGETTTYEYDNFQRLMNLKDKDGNIVKHMDYHYQGQ
jgi:YD repeat-containing protein